MNPLIPGAGDVLLVFALVLNTVLVIAALISLARAADKRRWLSTVLLIVLVPFAGPIVALIATRARRVTPAASSRSTGVTVS